MNDLHELLRPRVERGAALLDSVEPYWWKRIEEQLELEDCSRCVLGQIYGEYSDGVTHLSGLPVPPESDLSEQGWEKRAEWVKRHGFDVDNLLSRPGAQYHALDDLWLEAIAERRSA